MLAVSVIWESPSMNRASDYVTTGQRETRVKKREHGEYMKWESAVIMAREAIGQ
jgi:hypothetical protein